MEFDDDNSRLELKGETRNLIREIFELENNGHKDARELYADEIAGFFVKTDDGSYTLSSDNRHDQPSETLHSTHGALTEAYEKFVKPSKLLEKSQQRDVIRVLDICSGIGYNSTALLTYLKDEDVEIEIDMIESSVETLAATLFMPNLTKAHVFIKKSIEQFLIDNGYLRYNKVLSDIPSNMRINIHVCDAREFVKSADNKGYDAVFLDPFSPSKSPELYSVDFFSKIKSLISDDALVLTYSAASPVRSAFVHAGYFIGEGPRFHRSGGTVASVNLDVIDKQLSFDDEKVIALSDVGVPFIDPDLSDDFDTIVGRRQDVRSKIRGVTVFPSSSKLPRYLGVDTDAVDPKLLDKLNSMVSSMGFESISDSNVMAILDVDMSLDSSSRIIALERNLKDVLDGLKK